MSVVALVSARLTNLNKQACQAVDVAPQQVTEDTVLSLAANSVVIGGIASELRVNSVKLVLVFAFNK